MNEKIKATLKKKSTWAVIIVVIIVGYFGAKALAKKPTTVRYVTAPVVSGTLTSAVTGTGQINVLNSVDLKPSAAGQVTAVDVKEGQTIKAGTVIATVDEKSAINQISQAKASLLQAQANYDKVVDGLDSNDMTLAQLSLTAAQRSLDNARTSYTTTQTTQDQAVAKALTNLLNGGLEAIPSDTATTATVTLSGSYNGTAQGEFDISTYDTDGGIYYSVNGLATNQGPLTRGVPLSLGDGLYITFSASGNIITSTKWTVSVPNMQSSSYLSNTTAYTTAQQNETQALQQAQQSIDSAQDNLTQAQATYNEKVQPPTNADVASAQAQVAQAQAQLDAAEDTYDGNIIKAPFDGVVSKLDVQVGDQTVTGTAVATLITSQKDAEITLNEVDAAKVKIGQKATLTFPAIDSFTATGEVGELDVVGTVSQNVVSYSMKIYLDTQDDQVKPGMTVDAAIITDEKPDVLSVPSAAIKGSGDATYVLELENGQPVQHQVTTGISSDTNTEVSGDIKAGDEVVTQTITAATTAKATTSSASLLGGLGGAGATRAAGGFGGGNATFIGGATRATGTAAGGTR